MKKSVYKSKLIKILSAEAVYTGGGIYIYYGKLSDGTYFRACDDWDWIEICDYDTSVEDADYEEFYEEHFKWRDFTMTRIKTFRFKGSRTKYIGNGIGHENLKDSADIIDETINNFIYDEVAELIDIKITTVDCNYHNNGGYNDIDLIYTIIYR